MPLESCMILLDNSEYMRNGDYIPTRLEAQQDAANLLVSAKTQSHPESTVGVSAGTELLVSPTDDVGKILGALHELPYGANGEIPANICYSVQVASLALKHRRNKNGGQRIVLFVGSPLTSLETRALQKAGRQLKKNNVAIDVVAMGELEDNEEKLRELVEAANGRSDEGNRTCHLVTIPAGVLPSDVLASSPIVHGGDGGGGGGGGAFGAEAGAPAAGGGGGGGGFADFGGVDPNMDPELAMALRVSMEEERARQERVTAAAAAEAPAEEGKDADMADAAPAAAPAAADMGLSEEEALLQQALAMSMNENDPPAAEAAAAAPMVAEDTDEDAAMQMALQMSMAAGGEEEKTQQFQDPAFVNQLLGSLPGVDPNDPQIQNALRNIGDDDKKDDDAAKDKKDDKE
jgi:26S proteasome regulatory subunit N10